MLASPAGQKEDGSTSLYMLCLDLAAASSVAAQWITYGDDAVPRYFLIFVPIAWVGPNEPCLQPPTRRISSPRWWLFLS